MGLGLVVGVFEMAPPSFAGWCWVDGFICLFQVKGGGVVLLQFIPCGFGEVDGEFWGVRVQGWCDRDVGVYEVGRGIADG